MTIRSPVRATLRISACMALLALALSAGCKHAGPPASAMKPKAEGSALVESSGGKQVGVIGTALKDPLVVQVNDEQGTAVSGALVEFHGSAGVRFDPAMMFTDSSGQATTSVTLGTIAGRYRPSAVTPGRSKPVSLDIVETALAYQQRVLSDKYCVCCHDQDSSPARVSNFENLEVKPHPFTEGESLNKMSDADLTAIIQHSGPALNRSELMPPFGNTLSAADVRALMAYIRAVADPPYEPAGTVYARK